MKRLASVCGVVAALTIVSTAVGQDGEKRTIKHMRMFLIDAKTKGISEQTETKGTGIKQIEIQEGTIAKKTLLDAKYTTTADSHRFRGHHMQSLTGVPYGVPGTPA
jgi:hypothetical protein